jgi:hypothetical protein
MATRWLLFFKYFAITEHNLLQIDKKPAGDSLIMINVSKDLELVDDTGEYVGNFAITNRADLAHFFPS